MQSLEILILFIGERLVVSLLPLFTQSLDLGMVHHDLLRFKSECFNQVKVRISGEGSQNPKEGFLVLVVGLGRDIKVLQVALSVESDLSGLDFSILLINFVANQHYGDVITDASEIFVPLGHVFVGNSGSDIKHDDGGIATNIVAFT